MKHKKSSRKRVRSTSAKKSRKVKARPVARKAMRRPARKTARVLRRKATQRKPARKISRKSARAPQGRQVKPPHQLMEMQASLALKQSHPNLLVTYDPNKVSSAREEVERLLRDINEKASITESVIPGIFKVAVTDAKTAVRKLHEVCRNSPERFNRTFHWTPIDRWCSTDMSEMQNAVRELAGGIADNESWKMIIEKRHCNEHERDLLTKLTSVIDKANVNLADPDKILKIDILGDETGVALLRREEFLNVSKFKR